jgi:hypothetical protein
MSPNLRMLGHLLLLLPITFGGLPCMKDMSFGFDIKKLTIYGPPDALMIDWKTTMTRTAVVRSLLIILNLITFIIS